MIEIDNILQNTLKEISNVSWKKNEMWFSLINQISKNLTEENLTAAGGILLQENDFKDNLL